MQVRPRLSNSNRIRLIHILNHLALVYGAIYGQWWMWIVAFGVWNIIGSFGISIGYHRLLSHRSFETTTTLEKLFATIGCLASGGPPISWAGAHRMHHAHVDEPQDPHSPLVIGRLRSYFHLWNNFQINRRYVADLVSDRYLMFLQRNYFRILVVWASILFLIDPLVGVFGFCIPSVFAFHAFGLINMLCHGFGYRNFEIEDSSTNHWLANVFTCGEGWHNNHHKYPRSYRIGLKPGEWDLSAKILETLPIMKSHVHNPSIGERAAAGASQE